MAGTWNPLLLPGLSPKETNLCKQAKITTGLQLITTAPEEIEKASKGALNVSEICRLQHLCTMASVRKTERSLFHAATSHQEPSNQTVSSTQSKGRAPLQPIAVSSTIIPATPGQEEEEIPLTIMKNLPPSPPTSPTSKGAPSASCSNLACCLCAKDQGASQPARVQRGSFIASGVKSLDDMMQGGFRKGAIVDIVGESCAGKTQLILQTVLQTVLGLGPAYTDDNLQSESDEHTPQQPNWDNAESVAILVTNGKGFAQKLIQRLTQMVEARYQGLAGDGSNTDHQPSQLARDGQELPPSSGVFRERSLKRGRMESLPAQQEDATVREIISRMMNNIHIATAPNWEVVERYVEKELPALKRSLESSAVRPAKGPPLGLIVLDNLPAILNDAHTTNVDGMMRRSRMLCSLSDSLKALGAPKQNHAGAAVLVVNHLAEAGDSAKQFVEAHARSTLKLLGESFDDVAQQQIDFETQAAHSNGLVLSLCKLDNKPSANTLGGEAGFLETTTAGVPPGKAAQLGPIWANCVNARLMLVMTSQNISIHSNESSNKRRRLGTQGKENESVSLSSQIVCVRQAALAFSSWGPSDFELAQPAHFIIQSDGIKSVADDLVACSTFLGQRHPSSSTDLEPLSGAEPDEAEYWQDSQELGEDIWDKAAIALEQEVDEEEREVEGEGLEGPLSQ